jgi:hypothetical protein
MTARTNCSSFCWINSLLLYRLFVLYVHFRIRTSIRFPRLTDHTNMITPQRIACANERSTFEKWSLNGEWNKDNVLKLTVPLPGIVRTRERSMFGRRFLSGKRPKMNRSWRYCHKGHPGLRETDIREKLSQWWWIKDIIPKPIITPQRIGTRSCELRGWTYTQVIYSVVSRRWMQEVQILLMDYL